MSVSWGLKERVKFTAGGPVTTFAPPQVAAIYSVTYKQDPINKPKAHTVLFFGSSANLAEEPPNMEFVLDSIPNFDIRASDMFVFFHPMPDSSRFERTELVRSLIADYRPPANGY